METKIDLTKLCRSHGFIVIDKNSPLDRFFIRSKNDDIFVEKFDMSDLKNLDVELLTEDLYKSGIFFYTPSILVDTITPSIELLDEIVETVTMESVINLVGVDLATDVFIFLERKANNGVVSDTIFTVSQLDECIVEAKKNWLAK